MCVCVGGGGGGVEDLLILKEFLVCFYEFKVSLKYLELIFRVNI